MSQEGFTCVHDAVKNCNLHVVKALVEQGGKDQLMVKKAVSYDCMCMHIIKCIQCIFIYTWQCVKR